MSFSYTSNVPQPNQTVAATQLPILNNFGSIQVGLQKDHTWVSNTNNNAIDGESSGYHQQVSMPNTPDPLTLPTGIQGIYYVNSNLPKFVNNNDTLFINAGHLQGANQGAKNFTMVGTGSGTNFTLPMNSTGFFMFYDGSLSSGFAALMWFASGATSCDFTILFQSSSPVITKSGLVINVKGVSSSTATWSMQYVTS